MNTRTYRDRGAMSLAAARHAAARVRECLEGAGTARLVAATGASQFDFLDALVREPGIDWARVELFHLDEYVGLSIEHPASFRKYLLERLVVPAGIATYHFLDGECDARASAERVGRAIARQPVDLAFVGIGENGHLAFNDPPVADFDDPLDVKVVELDEACRRQQVGEGHFPDIPTVPTHAITVTIPALLRASTVLAIVPEARKAEPVRRTLEGPISTACPATILRRQRHATLYLDVDSASGLG
jgi:glucosamine-6-phosphate deaminase